MGLPCLQTPVQTRCVSTIEYKLRHGHVVEQAVYALSFRNGILKST
jgi:hypothetical protein